MRARSRARIAIALAAASVVAVGIGRAAPAATRVAVHVLVTGRDGLTPVDDFTTPPFRLFVDGAPVEKFELEADTRPLSVVLLLDVSQSERVVTADPDKADAMLQQALQPILAGARPNDHFRVGRIAGHPTLADSFVSSSGVTDQIRSALNVPPADTFGPSPIWDALYTAVDSFTPEPSRSAIVIVTDGVATGDHHFRDETIAHASENGVGIFSLLRLSFDRTGLTDAATLTGGVAIIDSVSDRPRRLGLLFRAIRAGYQLTFDAPVGDGALHRVDLRASTPNVLVIMRRYFRN